MVDLTDVCGVCNCKSEKCVCVCLVSLVQLNECSSCIICFCVLINERVCTNCSADYVVYLKLCIPSFLKRFGYDGTVQCM